MVKEIQTFSKVLARREVITLSFGAMIGWSWVLLTGEWLQRAGTLGAISAMVIGGIAVIFISLTYAELVSAMPEAGGEHVYTHRALGRLPSFICTWALIMAYVTVPVFESVALPTAMEYLFPDLRIGLLWRVVDSNVYASMVMVGVVGAILMSGANYIGIRFAAILQSIITIVFLLIGLSFIGGSMVNGDIQNTTPMFTSGVGGAMSVLIMVPALLVGFDVIPQSAEEINVPPEQIGKLLVFSVSLAVLWYVIITLAVSLAMDHTSLADADIATADANAVVWNSQIAGKIMIIAGIAGILTSWNAFILGGSRVIYAMAKSGLLPSAFAKLHPKYKTPYLAILMIGGLSCISPFFGRTILVWIIDAGSFAIVIAYGMVAFAFLRLRIKEPDMQRPFKLRYGMTIGYLALLMSIGLFVIYLPGSPSALLWPYEWAMVLGWILLGVIFYWLASRQEKPA
ncbi:MAG TPA: amino acid permease [Pseudomonadales bacterium]|jgi:amino acid transporter|nr:amino acid permease [Gammaproteobacteria bacterium]MDP6027734.1 amino acid permease [Pseudomonadales bacterium]MDP6315847.1 amino acid permease [Pseudomonadales bacterium]MDP7313999.1 amino acid permease [Pseudomonadales bacterium]HJP52779.1 amino acid permease [Pseudomonadales bacterium]|tara:strand:+ start:4012 stop:5379 length:1368 start_codon:yes stop_codon:yes gene_type:complete